MRRMAAQGELLPGLRPEADSGLPCLRREMRCNGPLLQRLRSLADSTGDVTVIIHKNTALLCFVHLLFKI